MESKIVWTFERHGGFIDKCLLDSYTKNKSFKGNQTSIMEGSNDIEISSNLQIYVCMKKFENMEEVENIITTIDCPLRCFVPDMLFYLHKSTQHMHLVIVFDNDRIIHNIAQ